MIDETNDSVAALSASSAHKELEKEDVRLEGDIKVLNALLGGFDNKLDSIAQDVSDTKVIATEAKNQAIKTNGRVTDLEKERVRPLENWKTALIAGGSVLLFLIIYFAWLIQSFLVKVSNLDTSINDAVDKRIPEITEEVVKQLTENSQKYNITIE